MKESSSESVLQKPIEKPNILQLAFGDGTTTVSYTHLTLPTICSV